MILVFTGISLLTSIIFRGNPKRLLDLEFQRLPWMLASFIIRDASEELFGKKPPELWGSALLAIVCYGLLFYGIFPNRRLPGMWTVGLGSALNFIVIAANRCRMPVSIVGLDAEQTALEVTRLSFSINHQLLQPTANLAFLADLYKWTLFQKRPTMFSIGDVLITAGVSYLVFMVSLRGFRPNSARGKMTEAS